MLESLKIFQFLYHFLIYQLLLASLPFLAYLDHWFYFLHLRSLNHLVIFILLHFPRKNLTQIQWQCWAYHLQLWTAEIYWRILHNCAVWIPKKSVTLFLLLVLCYHPLPSPSMNIPAVYRCLMLSMKTLYLQLLAKNLSPLLNKKMRLSESIYTSYPVFFLQANFQPHLKSLLFLLAPSIQLFISLPCFHNAPLLFITLLHL